jgi:hypothetical protein
MYSITINAKTPADLAQIAALLNGTNAAPEKTLSDFSMQEIIEHLESLKPKTLDVLLKEDEAKELKKASRKAQKVTVTETAENLETAETAPAGGSEVAENSAPESSDPKDAAIKEIMRVYTKPEGKKLANDLLKEFGCKNFHLVPDDRAQEFHDKTMAAISAAGL